LFLELAVSGTPTFLSEPHPLPILIGSVTVGRTGP
jgi:hypothetical protein